jgi:hypothetical protein
MSQESHKIVTWKTSRATHGSHIKNACRTHGSPLKLHTNWLHSFFLYCQQHFNVPVGAPCHQGRSYSHFPGSSHRHQAGALRHARPTMRPHDSGQPLTAPFVGSQHKQIMWYTHAATGGFRINTNFNDTIRSLDKRFPTTLGSDKLFYSTRVSSYDNTYDILTERTTITLEKQSNRWNS